MQSLFSCVLLVAAASALPVRDHDMAGQIFDRVGSEVRRHLQQDFDPAVERAPALRINVGGPEYTDSQGRLWLADRDIMGGTVYSNSESIAGTDDDAIYQTGRESVQFHNIPMDNGEYEVTLHFADVDSNSENDRGFLVIMEGQDVYPEVNIFKLGGKSSAVTLTASMYVSDNNLSMFLFALFPYKGDPIISGVEVVAPKVPSAPVLVNVGGPSFVATDGRTWLADKNYMGQSKKSEEPGQAIAQTDDDTLYQSQRSGVFRIEIPIVAGMYHCTFHFAELGNFAAGEHSFDLFVEGSFISAIDVVELGGGQNVAVTVAKTVTITDGSLTLLGFRTYPANGDPMLSGIEIVENGTTLSPTKTPTSAPTKEPVATAAPTAAPTEFPTKAPILNTSAPTKVPTTTAPTLASTLAPTLAPTTEVPTTAPTASPTEAEFEYLLINSGGGAYTDILGRSWEADQYFSGGQTYANGQPAIANSQDDTIYHAERNGAFTYEIPLDDNNYEVVLHFSELILDQAGERVFNVTLEGTPVFSNVDIASLAGGKNRAITLERAMIVEDGALSVAFAPITGSPSLSGIEIKLVGPHLGHAVANGPYFAVADDTDKATFFLDGKGSHTHAPGETLNRFVWQTGATVIGTGEKMQVTMDVGVYDITLTVTDTAGNEHTEATTVEVFGSEFPAIDSLSVYEGPKDGGTKLQIIGSGFTYGASETVVTFGLSTLSGSSLKVLNENTIEVESPSVDVAVPVLVTVTTPVGTSNSVSYTYIGDISFEWESGEIMNVQNPTVVKFGPDRKMYVGTTNGKIFRIGFQDGKLKINSWLEVTVSKWRAIMGITFDPMDTSENPKVYFASSFLFHGEWRSSSGEAINGRVSMASGPNLETVTDIVTGIPVSDHDHGVNALEFGDSGQLYIQVGGNTNAGVPGQISGSQIMKENVLSAATLVAYISRPNFDGNIQYDAPDDGKQSGGWDVEVFASGLRNPYGLVMHSNGYLYGTDNGPNLGYGDILLSCDGNQRVDEEEEDKITLLERGTYHGHANRRRGLEGDTRQCTWRDPLDPATNGFTPPLVIVPAATCGIIEFRSNHFGGQLRGNLISSKYTGALYRTILTSNGRSVSPQTNPPLPIVGDYGLDVTQAPGGELIEVRYQDSDIFFHRPVEPNTSAVKLLSIFPHRGPLAGGSSLHLYGKNLNKNGTPTVTVGGKPCVVTTTKEFRVQCTIPPGSGTVDITLTAGGETAVFNQGYRYIKGFE